MCFRGWELGKGLSVWHLLSNFRTLTWGGRDPDQVKAGICLLTLSWAGVRSVGLMDLIGGLLSAPWLSVITQRPNAGGSSASQRARRSLDQPTSRRPGSLPIGSVAQ